MLHPGCTIVDSLSTVHATTVDSKLHGMNHFRLFELHEPVGIWTKISPPPQKKKNSTLYVYKVTKGTFNILDHEN